MNHKGSQRTLKVTQSKILIFFNIYLTFKTAYFLTFIEKMPWTCPDCKRIFKNTKQGHSCVVKSLNEHFLNKEPGVRATYDRLESTLKAFGDFQVSPVINAILFSSESTFLVVKPKNKWLDLEFVLDYEANEFPIHKTVRVSKTRFAHFVRIQRPEEVDKQLIEWIKKAYVLNAKNV